MRLDYSVLMVFTLISLRGAGWAMTAPVLSDRTVPSSVKAAAVVGLSLFLTPVAPAGDVAALDLGGFAAQAVLQLAIGVVLGWIATVLFSAVEAAGAAIDLFSGTTIAVTFDPLSGNQTALFARLYRLVFIAVFFGSGAYLQIIRGFLWSFRAAPVGGVPSLHLEPLLNARLAGLVLAAALQIAAPILGALFITEAALALASRMAPQANIFVIGMPAKMLVALGVTGVSLLVLPAVVNELLDQALALQDAVLR